MRARHRTVAAVLALVGGVAGPAAAQPAPGPSPTVWTVALPANEGFERLAAFPGGTVYAQYGQGYAHSSDFGANWSFIQGPDGQTGNSGMLRWSTPQRGFAIVSRATPALRDPITRDACPIGASFFALDITLDAGKKWSPACAPVTPLTHPTDRPLGFDVTGLYVSRHDSTVVVTGDSTGPGCRSVADIHPMLFTSSDFGRHWRTISLPGGYVSDLLGYDVYDAHHIVVLAAKAEGTCAAHASGDAYAFVTTDGVHFKRVFRCPGIRYCTSSAWVTTHRLLVGLNDGQLYVSNNQGEHFFKGAQLRDADYDPLIASGAVDAHMFWAQALSFADSRYGFASTRGSGTWRTTDGGLRWVQEKSPECVYYPFGVGDVSAGDTEHGITGGPPSLDVRQPGQVELGCVAPQSGGPQISPATIAATESLPGTRSEGRVTATGRTLTTTR